MCQESMKRLLDQENWVAESKDILKDLKKKGSHLKFCVANVLYDKVIYAGYATHFGACITI